MNIWSLHNRSLFIYRSICIFFLLGIIISFPLWHADRLFPVIHMVSVFADAPAWLHAGIMGLLVLTLLANMIWSKSWLNLVLLGVMILTVLMDQMRLQPWVFIYFLLFIPYYWHFNKQKVGKPESEKQVLNYIRILLIATYVWSGLHKFSQAFLDNVYPVMLKGLFRVEEGSWLLENREWGYGMALVELLVGLGLIFPKTRNPAVILGILTHLLILAWVSPLGGNTNFVVLPWNVAMIVIVFLSCFQTKEPIHLLQKTKNPLAWTTYALVLLVWLMPALNVKDKWDAYLSFNLYTERVDHMFVALRGKAIDEVNPGCLEYLALTDIIDEGKVIDMDLWSFEEMNVPVYPSPRVHCAIAKYFCGIVSNEQNLMLVTYRKPFVNGSYHIFHCKDCN